MDTVVDGAIDPVIDAVVDSSCESSVDPSDSALKASSEPEPGGEVFERHDLTGTTSPIHECETSLPGKRLYVKEVGWENAIFPNLASLNSRSHLLRVTTDLRTIDPTPDRPARPISSRVVAEVGLADGLAGAFLSRYAGSTLRTYRLKLEAFSRWMGVALEDLPVELLARGATGVHLDAERYRAYLRDERHAAPATINGHLAAIRSVVRFMRRAQMCQWTLDVSSEKSKAYRDTRGPGLEAIRAVLRVAARHPDQRKAVRDMAIIRLLHDLGLRRSELVGLDLPNHVEQDAAGTPSAVLVRGKGSTERVRLTLPPKTGSVLRAWIAERGVSDGPLFVSLDPGAGRIGRGGRARALDERLSGEGVARILASLAERANVTTPVRPHGLRHTAITALLDHGAGLRETQRFSRHADPRTLMRYDDNRTDIAGEMARTVSELV